MIELHVHVGGFPDSDAEELAELTDRLRRELLALDVEDVTRPTGTAPAGARGDALSWAELIVTTAGTVPALIGAIRGWLGRHPGCDLSVEIDGDRLTVPGGALSGQQQRVLDAWLRKHES